MSLRRCRWHWHASEERVWVCNFARVLRDVAPVSRVRRVRWAPRRHDYSTRGSSCRAAGACVRDCSSALQSQGLRLLPFRQNLFGSLCRRFCSADRWRSAAASTPKEISMLKRLSLSDASSAATLTPHSGTSDGQTCGASTVGTTAFASLNHSPRGDPSDGCSASSITSYDRIRRTGGELRQRKYIVPTSRVAAKVSLVPDCGHGQRDRSESVLIQGPLQHQTFLSFWRWRWCVLDHHELRIYKNKEAFVSEPDRTVQRHRLVTLDVAKDLEAPQVIVCQNIAARGTPVAVLRTGPGVRWEELAAARLWFQAFAVLS